MTERNSNPEDIFDALRRLHNCNWQQLAERLDVSVQTLRRWRTEGPGKTGAERCSDLIRDTLADAGAEWSLLNINYGVIRTIGGKR